MFLVRACCGLTAGAALGGFDEPDQRDHGDKQPGAEAEHVVHSEGVRLLVDQAVDHTQSLLITEALRLHAVQYGLDHRTARVDVRDQLFMVQIGAVGPQGGVDRGAERTCGDAREVR